MLESVYLMLWCLGFGSLFFAIWFGSKKASDETNFAGPAIIFTMIALTLFSTVAYTSLTVTVVDCAPINETGTYESFCAHDDFSHEEMAYLAMGLIFVCCLFLFYFPWKFTQYAT
jgi:hypothetical protein